MPNKLSGDIKEIVPDVDNNSMDIRGPYHANGHYVFSIKRADRPFKSKYTGYYGLGAVKDFKAP